MIRTVLMIAALAAAPGEAEPEAPARAQLERFSHGLESLQARFHQVITGPDGRIEEQGAGEIWLQRPALFRWSYAGEFPELIVADGERVWQYDEFLEQVSVKPQSQRAEDSPMLLLTDPAGLESQFRAAEAGDFEQVRLLELVARQPESEFERVLLGFQDDELRLMILEDAFGMRTEIRFEAVSRNPPLSAELFRFEVPEGADVIGDAGAPSSP